MQRDNLSAQTLQSNQITITITRLQGIRVAVVLLVVHLEPGLERVLLVSPPRLLGRVSRLLIREIFEALVFLQERRDELLVRPRPRALVVVHLELARARGLA